MERCQGQVVTVYIVVWFRQCRLLRVLFISNTSSSELRWAIGVYIYEQGIVE